MHLAIINKYFDERIGSGSPYRVLLAVSCAIIFILSQMAFNRIIVSAVVSYTWMFTVFGVLYVQGSKAAEEYANHSIHIL